MTWIRDQVRPLIKFGLVGVGALVVDVGLFNLFVHSNLGHDIAYWPLVAKILSVSISTVVAWLGNRFWTFRKTRRKRFLIELAEYAVVAVGGMLIAVTCLWVSHYALGFTDLISDNISANVVGLVLATAFRYLLNRYWVFHPARKHHGVN